MRADALRTRAPARPRAGPAPKPRLSGEDHQNRKRMAEIGAVYDAKPAPRTPADILTSAQPEGYEPAPGPVARNKWLTASIVNAPAEVIKRTFDEAERRDPKHRRTWVALVDGANHQIERIKLEARKRKVKVTIVVDLVHVLQYLWNATSCLHPSNDQAAAQWVHRQATRVLQGHARTAASTIRRQATNARLEPSQRKPADEAATYLTRKAPYLDYPTALRARLADRDRDRRRRVPPLRQRSHGHHRRPLGSRRRRSHPQATRHHRQRRLRRLLALPPRPRTTPRPRSPLPHDHPSQPHDRSTPGHFKRAAPLLVWGRLDPKRHRTHGPAGPTSRLVVRESGGVGWSRPPFSWSSPLGGRERRVPRADDCFAELRRGVVSRCAIGFLTGR